MPKRRPNIPRALKVRVYARDNWACQYCGLQFDAKKHMESALCGDANPVHIDSQGNHVEPPSGIEERIAEVLAQHHWGYEYCGCGFNYLSNTTYDAHVAAVVAQALQPSAAEQKLAAIRALCAQHSREWTSTDFNGNPFPAMIETAAVLAVLDSDDTCPHPTLHGPTPDGGWICNKCGDEVTLDSDDTPKEKP